MKISYLEVSPNPQSGGWRIRVLVNSEDKNCPLSEMTFNVPELGSFFKELKQKDMYD